MTMMMSSRGLWTAAGLAAIVVALGGDGRAWAQLPKCEVPVGAFEFEPALPRTLEALEKGGPVTIVAIGGASTLGRAAPLESQSWPARLAQELSTRFPRAQVKFINRGVSRETAQQMAARLERDALAHKPDLVIWETGTTDAVRGTDVDAFMDVVQNGIARLSAANVEVMLMNPQFSRRSEMVVNFNRYMRILRSVADISDIPLFPRHEIMRYWADRGIFDFAVAGQEQRRELAIRVYACIGRAVADMIGRRGRPDVPAAATPGSKP
jgi:lysophospholipase L1-like esterase